jgi:hypothetical protein
MLPALLNLDHRKQAHTDADQLNHRKTLGVIREALDLDPIPSDLAIPLQGLARTTASGGREKADKAEGRQGGGADGMRMGGGMSGGLTLDRDSP